MRHTRQPRRMGHPGDAQRARQAAHVTHVGLHDVDRLHRDHVFPHRQVGVLLAAGDVERQGLTHLPRLLEFPVRTRFLEMAHAVVLQQLADLDRALRRITAVGVHQQFHAVAHGAAHGGHDLLGAARPLVHVVAAFGADPELEGIETELVTQRHQPRRLVRGRDVAFHRRRVGADRPCGATDQLAYTPAFALAAQVPQGGVQATHGPVQVGARELVFTLADAVHQGVDVHAVLAQRPRRHLPVQHLDRDVGVVGRYLAPALRAVFGRDAHETDEFVAEGLDTVDLHGAGAARGGRWMPA